MSLLIRLNCTENIAKLLFFENQTMNVTTAQLIEFFSQYVTEQRLEKINQLVRQRTRHITVALEDVYQSLNAGAIVRTCESLGIQDMHCIIDRNQFVVSKGIDQGASKWLTLHDYKRTEASSGSVAAECMSALRKNGYKIVATSPHAQMTISDVPLDTKLALLFGTELNGLTDDLIDSADYLVKIPMYGFSESFNVSVSVALCLYDFTKRLRASDIDWQLSEDERELITLDWLRKSIDSSALLEKEFYKRLR